MKRTVILCSVLILSMFIVMFLGATGDPVIIGVGITLLAIVSVVITLLLLKDKD